MAKTRLSFRSPATQAAHAMKNVRAHGESRHESKTKDNDQDSGKVHSIGTERNYTQALTGLTEWVQEREPGRRLDSVDEATAREYLNERSETVGQKTLDLDRQAIKAVLGIELERVKSEIDTIRESRAYTQEQIRMIADTQTPKNALATEVAAAAGLRAHELLTLRPATERPADTHRNYRDDRFNGRDGVLYTVDGKGGLVREVLLPQTLADKLESVRLNAPCTVYDREVRYQQHYDIGGGQRWSSSFSQAASRALGWSTGAHGMRHTYAQDRVHELQLRGYTYDSAKEIVSQELGHFRADVIDCYMR